ncbi:MAG: UDP-N-acetylglucosamine 1-carboxyvinyltransferase [Ruminococcaceae bacterium]|nr:UDP-N-acetylglucosamine 1-carboxyvinyltransferase [Oscillospiraceae bacterium]
MDKYRIIGGTPLVGEVEISPSKNAAVAIIPACILADGPCIVDKIPDITDVEVEFDILRKLGATVDKLDDDTVKIDCTGINTVQCDIDLVRQMRASYYFMGAMLGKYKKISTAYPGGCPIGNRQEGLKGINYHVEAFEALGAKLTYHSYTTGEITFETPGLKGNEIILATPSVGATINIMLAAVKAEGTTVIKNAAREPHVTAVANFLIQMGANIKNAGTDVITIIGVNSLKGANCEIIPDQIEAGTYMIMAAATGGDIVVKNIVKEHMESLTKTLKIMGVGVEEAIENVVENGIPTVKEYIRVYKKGNIKGTVITTAPYPGFPTDLQSILATLLCISEGVSNIVEVVTGARFAYARELEKMGAKITVSEITATINGVRELSGANVVTTDLRAGAALVVAGLCANGETLISQIHYIDRGYENLVGKIRKLGGNIERIKE